ncbi:23S rRNA (adenine(2030)-N(6))-methyltransferase RlmJ [Noviherbaspirillum galbum]|uniref:Ribosomal RNA large subunit methyltransferase J n=1 Tax=Noviherbaspirillum galbum TaxID=2709383 RepID=A0A6B3SG79_9BURK|nr:23S rRNA (adenine(2030)-N(6))-methyltransferase RlmJ [Noviherbaspirillum galbum]NEX59861.1 23S rRNA (adenine(2030)-N(6))-methyltransferase RlmJ [Noviherbaspirillum galbum]
MLSYRHAFHAGNHADVLKHMVFISLLRYLNQKDTAYMVIDTHAGAGAYQLDTGYAVKSGEARSGIVRLWDRKDLPEMVADYIEVVRGMNPDGKLRYYPGSPYCADKVLREQDRIRLFELHPSDYRLLDENFRKLQEAGGRSGGRGKRVMAQHEDGFNGLKSLLPPPSRRGLVLIDPPYEVKEDYRRVKTTLADALTRFPTGMYAVWYPVLQRMESRELPAKLKHLPCNQWLNVTLSVSGPTPDGFGLHSSGMFILNPPWTLEAQLREVMPWLVSALATDKEAGFTLQSGNGAPARQARPARDDD